MKLNKLIAGTAAAILLAASAFGVWAACGDTECTWVGSTYVCEVQTETGKEICWEGNTCSVTCP